MDDTRLGALLLEGNLVREADLERCLEIQSLTGGSRPLGEVLVDQQVIGEDDLEEILRLQQRRRANLVHTSQTEVIGIDRFLAAAASAGATDLILTEGRSTMLRIAGQLQRLDEGPLQPPEMWQFLLDHMGQSVLESLADQQYVNQEFVTGEVKQGRIIAFRHFEGACCSVRLHPGVPRTPAQAGLPDALIEGARGGRGLVLLTGEKRSGLTSTMATMLAEVVKGPSRLITVLDENQEYDLPESESEVIFRRVGRDTVDFQSGLESAIREDPDVIFVGDVSNPQTFDMALRAVEAGRFVVAGLNARTVQDALSRVLSYYPDYDVRRIRNVLATVLTCVMRQQLIPSTDAVTEVLSTELLLIDAAARAILREGHLGRLHLLMNIEDGVSGHSMDSCLEGLCQEQRIDVQDAFRHADDKARFLRRAKARREAAGAADAEASQSEQQAVQTSNQLVND